MGAGIIKNVSDEVFVRLEIIPEEQDPNEPEIPRAVTNRFTSGSSAGIASAAGTTTGAPIINCLGVSS